MKILAVVIIVLALLVAVVPQFTDCESQGKTIALANGKTTSMKCHWSARAEIAAGIPLFLLGAMLPFSRRRETIRALTVGGFALGAMTILIPTALVGVCATAGMECNTIMLPSLVMLGGLVILVSLAALLLSERQASRYSARLGSQS